MFMKKTAFILVLAILLSFTGCSGSGKPDDMNEEVYKQGLIVIDVCDDYIDGKISDDNALIEIEKAYNRIEKYKDDENSSVTDYVTCVHISLMIIAFDLISINEKSYYENKNEILESRNILAERLNEKTRKQ